MTISLHAVSSPAITFQKIGAEKPGTYYGSKNSLLLKRKLISSEAEMAQNSFGAEVEVHNSYYNSYALIQSPSDPKDLWPEGVLTLTAPFAPERVRELTKKLVLHARATVAPLRQNLIAECGVSGSTATFDSPYSDLDSVCGLAVLFDTIGIETPSGLELVHWRVPREMLPR